MRLRSITVSFLAAATMLLAETAQHRLQEAAAVFNEIMSTPDKGIPEDFAQVYAWFATCPGPDC